MFTFLMALSGLITFLNLMRGGSQWILVGMAMTVSIFLAVCTVLLLLAFLVEQSGGHVTEEALKGWKADASVPERDRDRSCRHRPHSQITSSL
jgi:hypothetical protein